MKLPLVAVATVFTAVFALPAFAQDLQLKPLPPPPAINSPGPKPATQAQLDQAKRDAVTLPSMHDDGGAVDGAGQPPPTVTVHSQGDDTVEEYREGGKIYMVRITPKNGVPRTIMADDDGKLERDPRLGPVAPVYYKVYEWGPAPKTAEQQAEQ